MNGIRMFNLKLLVLFTLMFTVLLSPISQATSDWFGQKLSMESHYYFYGEAETYSKARALALTDLTQQLSVSVQSETNFNVVKENNKIVKDIAEFSGSVKAEELSFPAAQWFKSDKKDGRFRVGGELAANVLIDWFVQDFTQIEAHLNLSATAQDSLYYYLFLQKNIKELSRANNTAMVLTNICQKYCDSNQYINWLVQYNKHISLPQRTCILIDEDSHEDIAPFLANMLVENGFSQMPVSNSKASCYQLSTKLRKTFTRQDNVKHVNGYVTLTLLSGKTVVAANKLSITGQSATSYSQALSAALNQLFESQQNPISLLTVKS
jgi:hypothetical protein